MGNDGQFDETVSRWMEETAPARLPERVLSATFERTRGSKQQVGWRASLGRSHMPRFLGTVGAAAVLVVAGILALRLYSGLPDGPLPVGSADPSPEPTSLESMWPQSSLEEARQAQELADAGDPRYTWQVDPDLRSGPSQPTDDTEIVARFLREELGWEDFRFMPVPEDGFGDGASYNNAFIRCAAGRTNPLYPNDPGACAPTIDDVRFERVSLDLGQPVRKDPSGIWVVTRWRTLSPFEQVAPASEADAKALLEAFIAARVERDGAADYVDVPLDDSPTGEVPLMYATSSGAPYERGDFERVGVPAWPDGTMQFRVRMFAEGGVTVVEQSFRMHRDDTGGLRLEYRFSPESAPTTENGQVVPVEYTFAIAEMTFQAAYPWDYHPSTVTGLPADTTLYLDDNQGAGFALVADPRPVETACQQGAAPADAAALARSIQSDPDLEATAPVDVSVGGVHALRLDVVAAPDGSVCGPLGGVPLVMAERGLASDERMRLYLLDLPGGSARTLAIAIITSGTRFERGVEAAAPLVDSVRFGAP